MVSIGDKKWCVYKHTAPNGKVYIGIAKGNPQKRWGANGNNYKTQFFCCCIMKYGWLNIKHEIVKNNLSQQEACEYEQFLIKQHKSNMAKYGYNRCEGGSGVINGSISEAVDKYTLDGKYIKTYKTITEAAIDNNADNSAISKCCSKVSNHNTVKGYVYRYHGDDIGVIIIQQKEVISIKDNIINNYKTISEAARCTNVNTANIQRVLNGKGKTAGGYQWIYANYYNEDIDTELTYKVKTIGRQIIQYDKKMNYINDYKSISEASRQNNVDLTSIQKCCKNKQKTAGGYIWKYKE